MIHSYASRKLKNVSFSIFHILVFIYNLNIIMKKKNFNLILNWKTFSLSLLKFVNFLQTKFFIFVLNDIKLILPYLKGRRHWRGWGAYTIFQTTTRHVKIDWEMFSSSIKMCDVIRRRIMATSLYAR